MSHLVGRIVVGVHGTPGSLQALRFAVGHARALDATLIPVIAWQPPGGGSSARHYPQPLTDAWAQAAEHTLLSAFAEGLGTAPADLAIEPAIMRGHPGQVLVAAADRESDLLVLGRSGRRTRLRWTYSGATAQYCSDHAECAVIVIPPSRLARELGSPRRRRRPRNHMSTGDASLAGGHALDIRGDRTRFFGDDSDLPDT